MSQLLATGIMSPDFRLRVTPDQDLSLSELRGQRVILSFYPADWSPVCGDQIALYNQVRPEFQNYGAEILGISVDGGLRKAQPHSFPASGGFSSKGCGRAEVRRVSRAGWCVRAGPLRDRPEGGDSL